MGKGNENDGFKLLAIRPMLGCNQRFLKALKAGQLYQFYNNYKFEFDKEKITNVTEFKNTIDLYSIERNGGKKLNINISAVVGKNGSGKSSIMELFFAAIYNFSMNRELLQVDDRYKPQELILDELKVQIIYEFNNVIYILDTSSYGTKKEVLEITILKTKGDFGKSKLLKREFNLRTILNDETNVTEIQKFLLENLYYTIAINYSVYSLNSRNLGEWINPLFHKNDGYKTPLVINPMRTEGDFNVNRELYLSKSRLMANLIHPDYINKHKTLKITENQNVSNIIYTLKEHNFSNIFYKTPDNLEVTFDDLYLWQGGKESFLDIIDRILFKGKLVELTDRTFQGEIALNYIILKLFRIAQQYDVYNTFLKGDYPTSVNFDLARRQDYSSFLKFNNFEDYLNLIIEDHSHITFKLRQAINYLKYNPLMASENCVQHLVWGMKIKPIELSDRIKKNYRTEKVINLLPPNIFEVDIELIDEFESPSLFNGLSSGEQQLIQSTQSIAYHLINLDSVFGKPKGDDRPTYKNVNLMLDEIELYFHPDMQRKFIKYLHDIIKRLDLKDTESINILLATHSPFILSDIPINNTLRLKDKGEPETEQKSNDTFGANIHDLLANDFFLEKGFIGEFAKEKINTIIHDLQSTLVFTEDEQQNIWDTIELIGEEVIRNSLISLYKKKFKSPNYKELLDFYNKNSNGAN